jgi:inhibitor of the pro-sigma K processing machinery
MMYWRSPHRRHDAASGSEGDATRRRKAKRGGGLAVDVSTVVACLLGVLVLYLLIRWLFVPLRYLLFILYNAVIGAVLLWVFDLVGPLVGLGVAINPFTAVTAGFLGFPGVALLAALARLLA